MDKRQANGDGCGSNFLCAFKKLYQFFPFSLFFLVFPLFSVDGEFDNLYLWLKGKTIKLYLVNDKTFSLDTFLGTTLTQPRRFSSVVPNYFKPLSLQKEKVKYQLSQKELISHDIVNHLKASSSSFLAIQFNVCNKSVHFFS